jgi:iron complex outermembrane receptor protein
VSRRDTTTIGGSMSGSLLGNVDLRLLRPRGTKDQSSLCLREWRRGQAVSVLIAALVSFAVCLPASADTKAEDQDTSSKDVQGASSEKNSSDSTESEEGNPKLEEIVVTGTLIRGIAPAGAETLSVSNADIAATGAVSTDQVLANIPQIGNLFNGLPQIAAGTGTNIQVVRPNLRNLPGAATSSGAATLVLVDGHRIVGAGVFQSAPDPDVVPPGVVERVEIVPDGGSSTYGADAVGGVINFITKRHFSGVQADGRFGFAGDYKTYDANATIGQDWGGGSVYVSYNYAEHDALFGHDRSYVKGIDWTTGIPTGRNCATPNVSVTTAGVSTSYAVPGLVPGTFNACDISKDATFYPKDERNSLFAGLSQDLGDAIRFDLRSFFTRRTEASNLGEGVPVSVNVTAANPFYRNLTGSGANQTQNIQFNYLPVFGNNSQLESTSLEEWGITPTLSIDLTSHWQLRAMFNYGHSTTTFFQNEANTTLQQQYANGTTSSTAIDPYDIAATPNRQLLSAIENWQDTGEGKSGLINARVIADGSLFTLPGGEVRVAAGAEYIRDSFESRSGLTVLGGQSSLPFSSYARDVKAAFGELQIPIVGADTNLPAINALSLSASGRYDDYSDFGHTFNPKFGVTYEPVNWIGVRGNWGKSFNAPTPVDELGALNNMILAQNFFVPAPAGQTPPTGSYAIALTGTTHNLQPQTAHTYSFGTDVRPPFVPGLKASVTYYHIDFYGLLGQAPIFNSSLFFPDYGKYYTLNPTLAQIAAFASQASGGLTQVAPFLAPGGPLVYELLDFRRTNLGDAHLAGLDYSLKYEHSTGFGSMDANFSATYQLKDELDSGPGTPLLSQIENGASRLNFSATIGANMGQQLRAQATLNHTQGYSVLASPTLPQDYVGSFDVVNLFFRYGLNGSDWSKDLAFTLGLDNVLNRDPPIYKEAGAPIGSVAGTANGATVGRLIELGVSKKF